MRKLTLKKETLAELSTADLTQIVGAGTIKADCVNTTKPTCGSEIDACFTARGCLLTQELC